MTVKYDNPNIILGAGRIFVDRLIKSGDDFVPSLKEKYIGDAVGASISATTQRTTIFSGSGPVAQKLVDKVTQIDRTIGITPQDATLDNVALFLIANEPEAGAKPAVGTSDSVTIEVGTPSSRDYFDLTATGAAPQGAPKITLATTWTIKLTMGATASGATSAFAILGTGSSSDAAANADRVEFDQATGRLRFTKAGITALGNNTFVKAAFSAGVSIASYDRVSVDSEARQVRVAVRYIEEPDDGVQGRNIYIPRASVSPAGEAQLMSRDTAQQFPLTLAIEEPDGELAQMYIDGVPS